MGKILKAFFLIFIVLTLLLAVIIVGITSVEASTGNVVTNIGLQSTSWVTSGAKLDSWECQTTSGKVEINIVKVDLQNPYIKVGAIYGDNGMTGDKQRVIDMAKEAGAVAAINGDFFTLKAEGAAFGVTIKDGRVINSPGYIAAKNAFILNQENIPSISRIDFDAFVTAQDGSTFRIYGLNKTQYSVGYRQFSGNSHINRLQMYDDKWNMENWVGDSLDSYTIVIVENGIVSEILDNTKIDAIPSGAYLLLGNGEAANYIKTHIHQYDQINVEFTYNPDSFIETAIDGSTLLVENGQKAKITYEIKGNHARTAIGYSQDNRYIYLISVEKSNSSVGMTLDELSSFLVSLEIWKAVNLDGGGSTTLVSRPLGQTELVNVTTPQYGLAREVPNGLAIYSTAPKGKLVSMDIILPKGVLLNEVITIDNIKAYDNYYNPVLRENIDINWSNTQGVIYEDNKLIFKKPGVYNLRATAETISKNYQVKVYERKDVKGIEIEQSGVIKVHEGNTFTPSVKMSFTDDTSRRIDNSLLDWQLIGIDGSISTDGVIVANNSSIGMVIVSYQGFSTSAPIIVGTSDEGRLIDSFNNRGDYQLTGLTGKEASTFTIMNDIDRMSGVFNYNFGIGNEMRIAYINYGTLGKYIIGEPAELELDINGDNSGHWLRATLRDANDKIYYLDLARKVDWIGWKSVSVKLPSYLAYPISLESISVVHLEDVKDKTAISGQLSFADMKIYDWNQLSIKDESSSIVFTVNKKEVIVDSESIALDQAPVIINGRTYIPIRHAAELLGGEVQWFNEEKKVQILKDNKIYNLWINEPYINENGLRKELDSKPFITNGRTMLPIRALSESFGMYVIYDSKTKTISIR